MSRIERDYRAGVLSVAQIARETGVRVDVIHRRAKRLGWVREIPDTDTMTAERRKAILAKLGPSDLAAKLCEFAKSMARYQIEGAAE